MSQFTSTRCDFCGTVKKESNHWWLLWTSEADPGQLVIGIGGQRDALLASEMFADACGEKCVQVGVQRFLAKGKLTE